MTGVQTCALPISYQNAYLLTGRCTFQTQRMRGFSCLLHFADIHFCSTAYPQLGSQEIGVLIGELARGNLGALRGSGITLANRAGWIDTLMSPKGMMLGGVIGGIAAAVYGQIGRASCRERV